MKIDKKYKFVYKGNIFFKNNFYVAPIFFDSNEIKASDREFYNSKFLIYGFKINRVISNQFFVLRSEQSILRCNTNICEVDCEDVKSLRIMEILDMDVTERYRSKGIGSQIINLLDKIASDNDIKYIVGELQEDRVGQPLDKRKRFFEKNGFEIWKDERSKFSKWVIKKRYL